MKLLAFDTSTDALGVALQVGDSVRVRRETGLRQQTEHLLPMVESLLAEAGLAMGALDAVACTHGPGAFTGVRVAVSTAQGLAFAAGVPAIGVSTLAVLAQGAVRSRGATQVLALLDARMDEFYAGAWRRGDDGLVQPLAADRLLPPSAWPWEALAAGDWALAGNGVPVLAAQWPDSALARGIAQLAGTGALAHAAALPAAAPDVLDLLPLAARELRAGRALAPEALQPVYLRDSVAWKKIDEQGRK